MPRANGIKFRNETLTCARSTKANLKIRDTPRPSRTFDERPNLILITRAVPPPPPPHPATKRFSSKREKSISGWYARRGGGDIFRLSGNGGGNDNDAVGKVFQVESPSRQGGGRRLLIRQNPTTWPGENWKSMDRSLDMLYTIFFLTARQPVCTFFPAHESSL